MAHQQEIFSLAGRLEYIAAQNGIQIQERKDILGSPAVYTPVPRQLHNSVYEMLAEKYPQGLYSHQAGAIESALVGNDVCLATPTASGKSLVFMAVAANLLKCDPTAKILALYPSKALIQDQLNKWKHMLRPLGFEPGYIDGGILTESRPAILDRHRIVIMTPDVTHAWLMSHLNNRDVTKFITNLRLLILDETHVYDGVFGTNMAYLLRRIQAVSPIKQIISSTATIGSPPDFLEKLTGRSAQVFNREHDGSVTPTKTILLARSEGGKQFEKIVSLLVSLSHANLGRFLAFGDSRKMVEQLVAATRRGFADDSDDADVSEDEDEEDGITTTSVSSQILPYRAGYEEEDRQAIQKALEKGELAGVVSTSALELGLDIGEIDVVLLLGAPPSVKAFWQRFGRAGRKNPGVCILLDDKGIISSTPGGLEGYLEKPPETGWLYLQNRYIQYANALCTATEVSALPHTTRPFETLPPEFLRFLQNELNPTEIIPDELYPLKQRAQGGPHYEFPLRSGIEKNFAVRYGRGPYDQRLGTLTFSQTLREAYPGAIYYYMARPYRVYEFRYKSGEILVKREKRYTTQPLLQNMVFPKFQGGLLNLLRSDKGFIVEAELQVSERVIGFTEQRGSIKDAHQYGPRSPYSQRPIIRFFETTGVCWYFSDRYLLTESVALSLLEAFCSLCGVQSRDLGVGTFHSNISPISNGPCQGMSIYDASHGSLRLTQQLLERFSEVVDLAIAIAESQEVREFSLENNLSELSELVSEMQCAPDDNRASKPTVEGDWVTVIAPGEKAMCLLNTGVIESVEIKGYRYTPQGLMYELVSPKPEVAWMVKASTIIPVNGVTKFIQTNLMTGETRELT